MHFFDYLLLVFIHLKLSGSIDWSWWLVIGPAVVASLLLNDVFRKWLNAAEARIAARASSPTVDELCTLEQRVDRITAKVADMRASVTILLARLERLEQAIGE